MIDCENLVYDTVVTAVEAAFAADYPGLSCYGEYVETPASFPCVTLWEEDNYTLRETQDEATQEHHAVVVYTASVYTANAGARKSLAKAIANVVDNTMQGMKFTRVMRGEVPNIDRSIYRLVLRYEAIVEAPKTDESGNETFQMYRRR